MDISSAPLPANIAFKVAEARESEGWKPAPEKDVTKKLTPYLVSWELLSPDIRKYDVETVKNIPAYLAKVGLEVYRLS